MRMGLAIEEDQLAGLRPDHGAVPLQRLDAARLRVVPDYEFTPAVGVVSEEQQACNRVGIHVALEPHLRPELHVQHHAVPIVVGRVDRLSPGLFG